MGCISCKITVKVSVPKRRGATSPHHGSGTKEVEVTLSKDFLRKYEGYKNQDGSFDIGSIVDLDGSNKVKDLREWRGQRSRSSTNTSTTSELGYFNTDSEESFSSPVPTPVFQTPMPAPPDFYSDSFDEESIETIYLAEDRGAGPSGFGGEHRRTESSNTGQGQSHSTSNPRPAGPVFPERYEQSDDSDIEDIVHDEIPGALPGAVMPSTPPQRPPRPPRKRRTRAAIVKTQRVDNEEPTDAIIGPMPLLNNKDRGDHARYV